MLVANLIVRKLIVCNTIRVSVNLLGVAESTQICYKNHEVCVVVINEIYFSLAFFFGSAFWIIFLGILLSFAEISTLSNVESTTK